MPPLRIFVDLALPPRALELLQQGTEGYELMMPQTAATSVLAQAERDPRLLEADIAFGQPDPEDLASATHLKWVQISSSGITRYDNPAFRSHMQQRGVPVCNSASVFNESCAVQTLSFMLAQARKLPRSLASQADPGSEEWLGIRSSCIDLRGQRAIILGYGAIGTRLVELLQPFQMKLAAYRRKPRGNEAIPTISPDELDAELPRFDHVINLLPDSAETAQFFDASRFARLKRGAIFYNIGRGATVDQAALREALDTERVAAAWLDVTDPEPLPTDHPLRSHPNCYITPHVAGGHQDEILTVVRHFLKNLKRFTENAPLEDRVM